MMRVRYTDGRYADYNESYARRLVACGRAAPVYAEKKSGKKRAEPAKEKKESAAAQRARPDEKQ